MLKHRVKRIVKTNRVHCLFSCFRFVWRGHCCSPVKRSKYVDRANLQVDKVPLRTIQSPRLHLECQGTFLSCLFLLIVLTGLLITQRQVTDNCRRGVVTMRINKRSRLADVDGCTKGYYRVSPFMKETKYYSILYRAFSYKNFTLDLISYPKKNLRTNRDTSALPVVRRRPTTWRCQYCLETCRTQRRLLGGIVFYFVR